MNELRVLHGSAHGVYLDGEELGEILLPRGQVPEGTAVGDALDVFIYRDSEDRLIATTQRPKAVVGDFASLRVTGVTRGLGAFLDWGLAKDLLLPLREQERPVRTGDDVVVYVRVDERSQRLSATTRLDAFVSREMPDLEKGQPVALLIVRETPLGFVCIVEGRYLGMVYHTDLRERIHPGQSRTGYVHQVRDDGRVDLSLDSSSYFRVTELGQQILDTLAEHGGQLDIDDDSPPERIREVLGASKKAFKQAVGGLYRQGKIKLTRPGIALA